MGQRERWRDTGSVETSGIADGDRILRHPIAAELEEIVNPVNIHGGADKNAALHIEANAGSQVKLKVVGAFKKRIGARATGKDVAEPLIVIELQVGSADAGQHL